MRTEIIIHTDGGARGNPGPAALGVVLEFDGKKKTYSKFLGRATNNAAEYQAVIFALKKTKALLGGERCDNAKLEVWLDSELIASQLSGKYKIKQPELFPWFIEIWNLKQDFFAVEYKAIRREQNQEADSLVNAELDKQV